MFVYLFAITLLVLAGSLSIFLLCSMAYEREVNGNASFFVMFLFTIVAAMFFWLAELMIEVA